LRVKTERDREMLTIRFLRQGRRNRAFFRIVLTESSKSSKSGFIKALGWYDPKTKEASLKKEEILNWVKCGAKPSNQLAKLLQKEKITHKNIKYVPNAPKAKKVKEEKQVKPAAPEKENLVKENEKEAETQENQEEKEEAQEAPTEPQKETALKNNSNKES